jgi:WD40 repeat protein
MATILIVSACGDDDDGMTGPPPTGSVEVTTATTGSSLDADGYAVSVASGAAQAVGVNATITVAGVATGSRSVELSGVAPNCTVAGDNPRNVTVTDGGTVSTTFDVTCAAVGSVQVTTATSGGAIDDDGYMVSVAGGAAQPIGVNETLTVEQVTAGAQSVELTGVASNCTVDGANPRNVNVVADAIASTQFDVTCIAPIENQIVFFTSRDGDTEVYVMDEDGSNPVNLTNDAAGDDQLPTVSPDGTRIAFTTDRDGDNEIYVMNADGSGQTNLTNTPGASDFLPAWSPDGSQILFVTDRDGDLEIYLMNTDGSGPSNLTDDPASDQFAAWSPDGTQIVFGTSRDGDLEIYVMNADGTGQTNLSNSPTTAEFPGYPDAWR